MLALLKLPDSDYKTQQLDAIVEDLSVSQRTKLSGYMAALEMAEGERKSAIYSAKTNWQQREAQVRLSEEQQKIKQVQDVEQAWNAEILNASDLEVFNVDANDPESVQYANGLLGAAKQVYTSLNNNNALARVALAATAMQPIRDALYAQVELNKRLSTELRKYKGAGPKVTDQKAAPEGGKKKSFVDAVMSQLG